MLALLIAAACRRRPPSTPKRAFARDAQRIGQWTAFRKYADDTAVMFTPQAMWAHEFLEGQEGPAEVDRLGPLAQLDVLRRAHRDHPRPLGDAGRQVERLLHHRLGAWTGRLEVDL